MTLEIHLGLVVDSQNHVSNSDSLQSFNLSKMARIIYDNEDKLSLTTMTSKLGSETVTYDQINVT